MSVESLMAAFRASNKPSKYQFVGKQEFVLGLEERIRDHDSIDQNPTSLCGPAALMRSLLMDNPALYVQYAINLFENGEAMLGTIDVDPSDDCKECDPHREVNGYRIAPVDWVTLASLRDSENDVFDYDDVDDEVGGITMPEDLAEWFTKVGYDDPRNNTSVFFNEGRTTLQEALELHEQGMRVCLLIEAELLQPGHKNPVFANHWVMIKNGLGLRPGLDDGWRTRPGGGGGGYADDSLLSRIARVDEVDLNLWSWGKEYQVSQFGRVSMEEFSERFHGYVAARFRGPMR